MTLLTSLRNWFSGQVAGPAMSLPYIPLRSLDGEASGVPIEAQKDYLRVILTEMQLQLGTEWFTTRYPCVYSLVTLGFGGHETDIAAIAGASQLKKDLGERDLDRSIVLNSHLTPLLPFAGGTVKVEAGLVSVVAHDAVKALVHTIGTFAGKLKASAFAADVDLVGAVVDSLQQMLGVGGARLKVRLENTFSGTSLVSGYAVALGAGGERYPASQLVVKDKQLQHEPSPGAPLQQVRGIDYMLFRVERVAERDDYASLAAIAAPFDRAVGALAEAGDDAVKRARELLRAAVVAALTSQDLTKRDQIRVAKALRDDFERRAEAFGAVNLQPPNLDALLRAADPGMLSDADLLLSSGRLENDLLRPSAA